MTEVLEKVEQRISELTNLYNHLKELKERQEKILIDLWKDKKGIASLIKENNYVFSHPSIKYHSLRGPILAHSNKDNTLYVFDLEKGLVKENLHSNEINNVRWKEIIENGWFEDAYEGINYLDSMIDSYISLTKTHIDKMQNQILNVTT